MYTYTKGHSTIAGTGIYLPQERVSTCDLMREIDSKRRFGVSEGWVQRVTGIKEKRLTPHGVAPSDMAYSAAKEAMERAKVTAREIDAIIYTGLTRDYVEPATAHIVQAKLGASNATVFDITNACHGFMNGIHVMDALIGTGQVRTGLIVTGEQGSALTRKAIQALKNVTDRAQFLSMVAALTAGDAGAAMILTRKKAPDSGLLAMMLQSQGQHAGLCTVGSPWSEQGGCADMVAIIGEAAKLVRNIFDEFLYQRLKWRVQELARCLVHQVGTGGFFKVHRLMGVPPAIMPKTVDTLGNLITANIPVSIHLCLLGKEIVPGDKIYLSGVGSGISLSQAGLVWDAV